MKIGFLMEGNEYSFARVMGCSLILFYMYNATLIMVKTGQLIDIPPGVAALALLSYTVGKVGEVVLDKNAKQTTISNAEHKE